MMRFTFGGVVVLVLSLLATAAHAGFEMDVDPATPPKSKAQRPKEDASSSAERVAPAKPGVQTFAVPAQNAAAPAPAGAPEMALIPEQAAAPAVPPPPTWVLAPKSHLRTVLNEWSRRAGWDVVWTIKDEQTGEDKDYELGGGFTHTGTYKDAVIRAFDSLPESLKVRAQFWSENTPPMLYVYKGELK